MNEIAIDKLTPRELENLSEDTICGLRNDERTLLYRKAADKYSEIGCEVESKNMQWEMLAFNIKPTEGGRRFESKYKFVDEDGTVKFFPDLTKDFSEETINYYKKRVNLTHNPLLKARYADIVWDFSKNHHYVPIAVRAYLDCGDHFINQNSKEWDYEAMKAFTRAMKMAWALNAKHSLDECLNAVLQAIVTLVQEDRFRYCLELIRLLLKCSNKLQGKINFDYLRSITEGAAKFYQKEQSNINLQKLFLELLIDVNKVLKDNPAIIKAKLQMADMFIRHAEWQISDGSGHASAGKFYEKALDLYLSMGSCSDKVQDMMIKIQESYRIAQELMIPVSDSIEIPNEIVERKLTLYDVHNVEDFLYRLIVDPELLPSWSKLLEQAERNSSETPLSDLFDTLVMKGNIVVKGVRGKSQKLEYRILKIISFGYQVISSLYLTRIFERLKERFPTYQHDILSFIGQADTISPTRNIILRVAIDRFFSNDYISACTILVFQIEGILRDMVKKIGLSTYSISRRTQETRELTLTELLNVLGEYGINKDLLKVISVILADITGKNLRNDIAHGICGYQEYNQTNAQYLLYILFRLSNYQIATKKEDPSVEL